MSGEHTLARCSPDRELRKLLSLEEADAVPWWGRREFDSTQQIDLDSAEHWVSDLD